MKKLNSNLNLKLDAEEQELLIAFEAVEMKNASRSKASLAKFKAAATETISKEHLFKKPSNLAKNIG